MWVILDTVFGFFRGLFVYMYSGPVFLKPGLTLNERLPTMLMGFSISSMTLLKQILCLPTRHLRVK